MMTNNFTALQNQREEMFDDQHILGIEHELLHQIRTYNHFGDVVTMFGPNAFDALVHMVSGGGPKEYGGQRGSNANDWRVPPGKLRGRVL
jgi:hypothetical protein